MIIECCKEYVIREKKTQHKECHSNCNAMRANRQSQTMIITSNQSTDKGEAMHWWQVISYKAA